LRGLVHQTPGTGPFPPYADKVPCGTRAALHLLTDDGVIDEVIRSLKNGNEGTVHLLQSGAHTRRAKVYRVKQEGS
jgi:hypothetical protein